MSTSSLKAPFLLPFVKKSKHEKVVDKVITAKNDPINELSDSEMPFLSSENLLLSLPSELSPTAVTTVGSPKDQDFELFLSKAL